jgi:hypothetical protein
MTAVRPNDRRSRNDTAVRPNDRRSVVTATEVAK